MTLSEYVASLNERYKAGISREHSYRGDLQALLESMLDNVLVTNEPARIECGAPDYILTKKGVPVGYMEAKDIGEPLKGKKHKEQFERYKESLPNLIITDYLDFHLYREGEFVTSISIAERDNGSIESKPEKFNEFKDLVNDFATHTAQTITSSSKLSKMMAGKARLLSTIIENALNSDQEDDSVANNTLREQLEAFQNVLIHDIDAKEFADIYAQTIAYGMFAARLHDPTLDSFSRQEAAQLIPKTNPFLRKLFQYIAGYDLDERIDWVVDALADIFRATDVSALLKDFGKATQQNDPIIHFYETFLAEFDPDLRKSRGVWYTPEPVVNFIVRAVDDILEDEFDLSEGLADTSKTNVKVKVPTHDKRHKNNMVKEEREVHRVQILDPAAGTGTFLAEAIKQIHSKFEGQKGIWPSYVENHLIPRLNGFELLMASYAMAHLKLDMLLKETGYNREADQRFKVYLTNSLEEHHPDTGTLFASWLSEEANQANHVKRDTPVMVVMGNPPYNRTSRNSNEFASKLVEPYKNINERNLVPLEDDYVKFISYAQFLIDKNGEGVVAYISNNSFIEGITHRAMRESLEESFDEIYVINLHGNSIKGETTPDGKPDENVFDIQQGVSINIFVKKEDKDSSSRINYFDLYGKRNKKYNFLLDNDLESIDWELIQNESQAPWVPLDQSKFEYNDYLDLVNLFKEHTPCIRTHNDKQLISFNKYNSDFSEDYLHKPFDVKYVNYDPDQIGRSRMKVMKHILDKPNIGIIFQRGYPSDFPHTPFITKVLSDQGATRPGTTSTSNFAPIYLYPENKDQQTIADEAKRKPNLNLEIVQEIAGSLGLTFTPEKEDAEGTFAPIDLLDYIYGVLHSRTYRETYKEFLKIDFPRVPSPTDPERFWHLVELGGELRQIHLLEHPIVNDFITTYPVEGSNEITKRLTKTKPGFILNKEEDNEPTHTSDDHRYPGERLGRIQINNEQYFGRVPEKAWNFYIGGYQPAEKWLKARRDRELSFEEIQHYQKIIVALMETDRLMGEIDEIEIGE